MSNKTLSLTDRQINIIADLLEERIEDLDGEITHFTENPDELAALSEPGEDPLTLEDYQSYRDELTNLYEELPEFSV